MDPQVSERDITKAHEIADKWAADAIGRGTRFLHSFSLQALENTIATALAEQRNRIADMVDTMAEGVYKDEPPFSTVIAIAAAIRRGG